MGIKKILMIIGLVTVAIGGYFGYKSLLSPAPDAKASLTVSGIKLAFDMDTIAKLKDLNLDILKNPRFKILKLITATQRKIKKGNKFIFSDPYAPEEKTVPKRQAAETREIFPVENSSEPDTANPN